MAYKTRITVFLPLNTRQMSTILCCTVLLSTVLLCIEFHYSITCYNCNCILTELLYSAFKISTQRRSLRWPIMMVDAIRMNNCNSFIHSFIHIEHLYSASSRKLLRSAPNTSTVKQSSLKVRKKTQAKWFCYKCEVQEGGRSRLRGPPQRRHGSA